MEKINVCLEKLIRQKIKEVDEKLIKETTQELKELREKLFRILWEVKL